MATTSTKELGSIFRCAGIRETGTFDHGKLGFVQLIEAGGTLLTVAFPPGAAPEIANRVVAAADMAEHQLAGDPGPGGKNPPAPMVTNHQASVYADGDTIVLTLMTGSVPLALRLSKSRSEKLRASLEGLEAELGKRPASANQA